MVFAEARYYCFVVDDGCGVVEVAAFAEDLLADLFFFLGFAHVDVDVFEFDVVVFQELFGHFAPDACAEGINDNLVVGFFTLNF